MAPLGNTRRTRYGKMRVRASASAKFMRRYWGPFSNAWRIGESGEKLRKTASIVPSSSALMTSSVATMQQRRVVVIYAGRCENLFAHSSIAAVLGPKGDALAPELRQIG